MSVTEMSQRESRRDFGVSHTTPTRPDPTRPLYQWSPSVVGRWVPNPNRHLGDGAALATFGLGSDLTC